MTWAWFTQSTPDTATNVASASDNADLATIDQQVLAAYSQEGVIRIARVNTTTHDEVVLLDNAAASPWLNANESSGDAWAYAIVSPRNTRIGPLGAGLSYTYLLSDALYAAAYNDLKDQYQSPLITTDGETTDRVWLYRYSPSDPSGIYPIVWEEVGGGRSSGPDASTVLSRSVESSAQLPNTSTNGGGGPVSAGGPVTITSTGTRQSFGGNPSEIANPEAVVLGIGAAGVLLTAFAGLGLVWFLIHEAGKR